MLTPILGSNLLHDIYNVDVVHLISWYFFSCGLISLLKIKQNISATQFEYAYNIYVMLLTLLYMWMYICYDRPHLRALDINSFMWAYRPQPYVIFKWQPYILDVYRTGMDTQARTLYASPVRTVWNISPFYKCLCQYYISHSLSMFVPAAPRTPNRFPFSLTLFSGGILLFTITQKHLVENPIHLLWPFDHCKYV